MSEAPEYQDAIERAVAGDHTALSELLYALYSVTEDQVRRAVPADLRSLLAAEDVLQDVHLEVFRTMHRFSAESGWDGFQRWVARIAQQRMLDRIRELRRAKRGGGHKKVEPNATRDQDRLTPLLELLQVDSLTPSRVIRRQEWARTLKIELAGLNEDYREALRLRYLEGLSIAEVATALGRSDRAAQMLCHRGLKQLRDNLGNATRFLSRG